MPSIWYPCLLSKDRNELEIAGELSLAHGGFVTIGRGEATRRRILSLSAVIFNSMPQFFSATQSSSRRNDSFVIVKEAENQTTASRTTFDAEVLRFRRRSPIPEIGWGFSKILNLI